MDREEGEGGRGKRGGERGREIRRRKGMKGLCNSWICHWRIASLQRTAARHASQLEAVIQVWYDIKV